MSEKQYTQRGFRNYDEFTTADGMSITVRESSAAGHGPVVWVFCEGHMDPNFKSQNGSAHLRYDEAKRLHQALGDFLREAENGELTERPERAAEG